MSENRIIIIVVTLALAGATPCALAVRTPSPDGNFEKGMAELSAAHYAESLKLFDAASSAAKARGDAAAQGDAEFYAGLTLARQAPTLDGAARTTGLSAAAGRYEAAMALMPPERQGGTANNLALVRAALGQHDVAERLLLGAINLKDAQQDAYTINYADLLAKLERNEEAVRFYRQVAARPGGGKAMRAIEKIYAADPKLKGGLPNFLRQMMEDGAVLAAQGGAIDALANREQFGGDQQPRLMGVVAACLSRQRYDAGQFAKSEVGRQLATATPQSDMAAGLFRLHADDPLKLEREMFAAWTAGNGDRREGEFRPADDFRALIRALGDCEQALAMQGVSWMPGAGAAAAKPVNPEAPINPAEQRPLNTDEKGAHMARAEAFYRLAIALIAYEPDLDAVQATVDLYVRDRKRPQLDELLRTYEHDIFQGKHKDYLKQDWASLYKIHRTLGVIYFNVQQVSEQKFSVASAEFQLSAAIDDARWYNGKDPGATLLVEPKVIDLLARTYVQVERADKAVQVRVDWGEKYLSGGQAAWAKEVIVPAKEMRLPENFNVELKTRLDKALLNVDHPPADEPQGTLFIHDGVPYSGGKVKDWSAAVGMAGGASRQLVIRPGGASDLSQKEIDAIGPSVSDVFNRVRPGGRPASIQVVGAAQGGASSSPSSAAAAGLNVAEVKFDGTRGSVIVEKDAKRITVPFVATQGAGAEQVGAFHAVRGGTNTSAADR